MPLTPVPLRVYTWLLSSRLAAVLVPVVGPRWSALFDRLEAAYAMVRKYKLCNRSVYCVVCIVSSSC